MQFSKLAKFVEKMAKERGVIQGKVELRKPREEAN